MTFDIQTSGTRGPNQNGVSLHPRVLVVVPQPFYSDRGSPIAIREVVRAYLDLGWEVDVATFPLGRTIEARKVRFFRCPNPFGIRSVQVGFSIRKLLLDLSLTGTLWRRLRSDRYQVVHAVEEAVFPAVWLARGTATPVLYDMHSRLTEGLREVPLLRSGPLRRASVKMEEWVFRSADVIVTSKGLAEEVRLVHPGARVTEWHFSGTLGEEALPEPPGRVRERLGITPGDRVVLYAGTFTRYQGIDLLLEAAARTLQQVPDTVFVLIGAEPQDEVPTRELARQLGIDGRVRIVAREPRERMPTYFAMADVLVSPRINGRNVPLKIFDYLSADRPILATDIPTHRTVLDDGTALLVPPDPAAFAEALSHLLLTPELAERLRRNGRGYAATRLGWTRFLESLQELLQDVGRSTQSRGWEGIPDRTLARSQNALH